MCSIVFSGIFSPLRWEIACWFQAHTDTTHRYTHSLSPFAHIDINISLFPSAVIISFNAAVVNHVNRKLEFMNNLIIAFHIKCHHNKRIFRINWFIVIYPLNVSFQILVCVSDFFDFSCIRDFGRDFVIRCVMIGSSFYLHSTYTYTLIAGEIQLKMFSTNQVMMMMMAFYLNTMLLFLAFCTLMCVSSNPEQVLFTHIRIIGLLWVSFYFISAALSPSLSHPCALFLTPNSLRLHDGLCVSIRWPLLNVRYIVFQKTLYRSLANSQIHKQDNWFYMCVHENQQTNVSIYVLRIFSVCPEYYTLATSSSGGVVLHNQIIETPATQLTSMCELSGFIRFFFFVFFFWRTYVSPCERVRERKSDSEKARTNYDCGTRQAGQPKRFIIKP